MPLPGFLKPSAPSKAPEPPARPPSPLSAANAKSASARPSTSSSSAHHARRTSASRGPPSVSSASSISGVSLSSRNLAAAAEAQPPLPPSQSSRSLSSRLLRRRPSEKTSLARTPRLPALVSAASESDGPTEPLTGSTTGTDVFADQQDMWGATPIMTAEERRQSEVEWAEERSRIAEGGPIRRVSETISHHPYPVSSESPYYMDTGYTALPPPPRPGGKRYDIVKLQQEREELLSEADKIAPPGNLAWALWGRRASDPVKYATHLASRRDQDCLKDYPYYQPPAPIRSNSERDAVLANGKQNGENGRSRFGDAPPVPSRPSQEGSYLSPAKRAGPKSPHNRTMPPPRTSSKILNADLDMSASPSQSSSTSYKSSLVSSQKLSSNSVSSNGYSPLPTHSQLHSSGSPNTPLQYQLRSRSPKPSSSNHTLEDPDMLSPTRPPKSIMRPADQRSVVSANDASAESEDEEQEVAGAYEVSVVCTKQETATGEVKWEITVRPATGGVARSETAPPARLSGDGPTVVVASARASHVKFTLALEKPDGIVNFVHPILPGDAQSTPTRRPRGNRDNFTGFSGKAQGKSQVWGPHARGETFGKEEARTAVQAGESKSNGRTTPPPRMSTPPPLPSNLFVNTTPTSSAERRQPHSRSTSQGDRAWALSPSNTTPTAASGTRTPPRSHTPRELTYVSSPSPRSTPRRTRIVSASQLNGGLFAHGTVDGMTEEAEGVSA